MALQTIAWGRANLETANSFIMNEIYPETDVPEPAEIFDSCKDFFEIVHLVADRQAYTWTLNEWRKRLRAQRKRALDLVDTATFERYERYLSLCAIAFHIGNLTLLRLILARL